MPGHSHDCGDICQGAGGISTSSSKAKFFVIAFVHVGSRKVFVTPATEHPTAAWVQEQAEAFVDSLPAAGLQAKIIFHDRDTKFGRAFDDTLRAKSIAVHRSPVCAPNICAYVA